MAMGALLNNVNGREDPRVHNVFILLIIILFQRLLPPVHLQRGGFEL